ncbi:MAG TPA: cyclic nucleotide-binding domain-containing protein [Thermoleophilaceae bacterium]|jgi:CRP-like cAMP-binding protein|nr:cyclic nucleotide-binding domain-containing protein [Thermoleophilaceae bacterium]
MDESNLRSIALFESLSAGARRTIARHADEIDVPEGTELARQGEFAYEFFVIEDGTADVLRAGERIAELGPGDFLGEMGIVGKVVRNATVVTTSPARVIVMTSQAFRSMAATNPDVAARISAAVEERCRALVA